MALLPGTFNPDDHPDDHRETNLAVALDLAEAGVAIFPARVSLNTASGRWDKEPCVTGWQVVATTDQVQIRRWWMSFPEALPGIALGKAGLVVIDADRHGGPDGIAAFTTLTSQHGELPRCPISRTAGGGQHFVFANTVPPLGNATGSLPPGIDVRGAGGWIVAPGAIRADGAAYEPVDDAPDLAATYASGDVPAIPEWLVEIIRTPKHRAGRQAAPSRTWNRPRPEAGDRERAYALRALDGEAAEVATAPSGTRNAALNRAALKLGHQVAAGRLSRGEVEAALLAAAESSGLIADDGERAALATIASGLRAGMQEPAAPLPDRDDAAENAELAARLVASAREKADRIDPATGEILPEDQPATGEAPSFFDPWREFVVPDFPFDVLPPALAAFVEERSVHVGACRNALAMAALAACSGAIDHRWKLRMQQHGGWTVGPRLWVLLVGDPSRKKTPVINAALAPIEEHEDDIRQAYQAAMTQHLNAPMQEEPPKPERFVMADVTVEKLGEVLSRQARGVVVKRDELSGWIGSMEKYAGKGSAADRAFWLKAFDGGPFTVDRIQRGEAYISNLSVTLIGGIQPARLAEMRGLTSDGLLQRLIPVMMGPSSFPEDRPFHRDGDPYARLVSALLHMPVKPSADGPVPLRFDANAAPLVRDLLKHLHDLEQTTGGFAAGLQGFVGKLAGLFGSLAMVLHFADHPDGRDLYVGAETAARAARIVREFILPHAFDFYRSAETATDGDRLAKVASYILTSGKVRFVASDFTRNVAILSGLGLWDLNKALSPLVAGGWLVPGEAGPMARRWDVARGVVEHFAERAIVEDRRKAGLADLMNSPRRTRE